MMKALDPFMGNFSIFNPLTLEPIIFKDISLSDIASSGNVSERECLRAFSRTLGTSPVQYLISYRLAESRKLLQMTDLSIGEVAYRTGFSTPAHFSRSFREDSGYSPTQWRRKL